MTFFNPELAKSQRALEDERILVIYNTNDTHEVSPGLTESEDLANYYISQRGLTNAQTYGFPFNASPTDPRAVYSWDLGFGSAGNPMSAYEADADVTALRAWLETESGWGVTGPRYVILSMDTPYRTNVYEPGGTSSPVPTANWFANLLYMATAHTGLWPYFTYDGTYYHKIASLNSMWATPSASATSPVLRSSELVYGRETGIVDANLPRFAMPVNDSNATLYSTVPSIPGRLGRGKYSAEAYVPAETLAFSKDLIDKAIANERSIKEVREEALPIWVGIQHRNTEMNANRPAGVYDMCKKLGFNTKYVTCNMTPDAKDRSYRASDEYAALVAPEADSDRTYDDIWGGIDTDRLDCWAYIGYTFENIQSDDLKHAYTYLPGAWGWCGTSSGRPQVERIQVEGSSGDTASGIGGPITTGEPFVGPSTMPLDTWFFHLIHGEPMALATQRLGISFPWRTTVIGDPLYAPFGKERLATTVHSDWEWSGNCCKDPNTNIVCRKPFSG